MEFLKNVFGDKALTFADFKAAIEADKSIKLANLADGKYVDKDKLDKKANELTEAQDTITKLNGEIETLKANGADVEELKQTIADYEAKEQKRTTDEAAAKELEALKARVHFCLFCVTFCCHSPQNGVNFKNAEMPTNGLNKRKRPSLNGLFVGASDGT